MGHTVSAGSILTLARSPGCGIYSAIMDGLLVVNPKVPCSACQGHRRRRRSCDLCSHSGYTRVDLTGFWGQSGGFLVCGGPSLKRLPVHLLRRRGIVSLAINNAAGFAPVSAWTFSDPQTKFHWGQFVDPSILTFAPIPKCRKRVRVKLADGSFRKTDKVVGDCPSTLGYSRTGRFDPETFLTNEAAYWGHGGKGVDRPFTRLCTMLLGIRLLHYLGIRRVYLLGVDFFIGKEEMYAWAQDKQHGNRAWPKIDKLFESLVPVFKADGFEVFNCNPTSKFEVFPYASFDDAYDYCRRDLPPEPYDLVDWYTKRIEKEHRTLYPNELTFEQIREHLPSPEQRKD